MSSKAPVNHGLRRLNLGIVMMLSASATSGYNASQINSLLVLPQFTEFLSVLSSSAEGLVIAAVSLGAFLTFVPAAYAADKLGRKKAVLIGSTLCIIASIIQTAVKHPWVFFAARVLTGSGVAFSQTAAPLLIAETAYPSQRPTLTGLYNSVWFCGSITAAAIAFGTLTIDNSWSWRVPCLLQVLYPSLQLVALLIIPESPRWLVSKNRQGEALAMLTRYHGNGDIHNEMVQEEYDQICASIHAEADQKAASQWSAFFKTRGDIHRLVICILLGFMQEWTGNGVTSYYLPPILASVGITNAVHEAAVNISLQFWNLIFAVSGASLSNRVGRRTLWLGATSVMIIFLAAATVMSGIFSQMHIIQAGIAVVPLLFCFNAAFDFAYMPLFIAYPAEILPFQLRAKGLAVTLTTDSLACFFNQYVNPVAFAALRWRYFSIYVGCLVVVIALVYFFFPETQGRSLEEVAQIFETPKLKDKEANMSDSDVSKSSFVIKYEE